MFRCLLTIDNVEHEGGVTRLSIKVKKSTRFLEDFFFIREYYYGNIVNYTARKVGQVFCVRSKKREERI